MAGIKKTREELFENFDAPFSTGNEPANQDFQNLGASFQHKGDTHVLVSDLGTMSFDEVFTQAQGSYFERDPGGANRTFNPQAEAAFERGYQVILVNTADAAETITFDSDGLAAGIGQGQRGIFVFNGVVWRKIFVG